MRRQEKGRGGRGGGRREGADGAEGEGLLRGGVVVVVVPHSTAGAGGTELLGSVL